MTEIKIGVGAPCRVSGWRVTREKVVYGYIHWPAWITVDDISVEVDCWTLVGAAIGHTDLDGSALDPNCRGKWRQLSTDGSNSGLPRIRAARIKPGILIGPGSYDVGNGIVHVDYAISVEVEIGAGHDGPYETLTISLHELRELLEHVDEDGYLVVTPPDCNEAVYKELMRIDN